ncbi:MAG: gliding motility-associated protein GldE [Bacteroidota bacterium]
MESELLHLSSHPLLFSIQDGMLILSILLLLICSALISGSEIAFFSLTDNDKKKLEEEGSKVGLRILYLLDQPRKLLATILISNNFVNVAIIIVSALLIPENITGNKVIDFSITVVGVTFLLVLFGEISPKVYANRYNIRLAKFMANPLHILNALFYLPSIILVSSGKFLERRFAHRISQSHSREDIDEAIDLTVNQEEGSSQDADILKSIVKFGEVPVKQIMRPRVDVIAVDIETTYSELLKIIKDSGYSRIPIYENDFDKVVGVLYVKDLIGHLHKKDVFKWQNLIRKDTVFVPEAKKIDDLLRQFQLEHKHLAIVVDEYGGSAGIVTLEDILEEIIGDIRDEFDDEPDVEYRQIDAYNYEFEGKTLINDFARVFKIDHTIFEEARGDSDSLAGMILELTGKFPSKNQVIEHQNYAFKVTAMSKRRIEKVLVTLPKEN